MISHSLPLSATSWRFVVDALRRAAAAFRLRVADYRQRNRETRELAAMGHREWRDIGLTPGDVDALCNDDGFNLSDRHRELTTPRRS